MAKMMLGANGPKCLDGSQAGFYYRRGSDAKKWVLYLEGGGLCTSAKDCTNRKKNDLGSSKNWGPTIEGWQTLSPDSTTNPDFWNWNHVYIPYCSGDIWLGQQATPMNPFGEGDDTYVFQGHDIIAAVSSLVPAANVTHILLTGCSAGGIGTFQHADWFAETFPSAVVKANPDAGWFGWGPVDSFPYFNSNTTDPDEFHYKNSAAAWLLNDVTLYTNNAHLLCLQNITDPLLCGLVEFFYPYIKTPILVSENIADSYQVGHSGAMPDSASDADKGRFISYFGGQMASTLQQAVLNGPKKDSDGIFAPACYQHCLSWKTTVSGYKWSDVLGNWYFGRDGPTQLLDHNTDIHKLTSC